MTQNILKQNIKFAVSRKISEGIHFSGLLMNDEHTEPILQIITENHYLARIITHLYRASSCKVDPMDFRMNLTAFFSFFGVKNKEVIMCNYGLFTVVSDTVSLGKNLFII